MDQWFVLYGVEPSGVEWKGKERNGEQCRNIALSLSAGEAH